jgi:hypothetical protein
MDESGYNAAMKTRLWMGGVTLAVALGLMSGPADARRYKSWRTAKKLAVKKKGHTFLKATGWSTSCIASFSVYYHAPKRLYAHRNFKRNSYRFLFVVTMRSGRVAYSEALPSSQAGAKKSERFSFDTRPWGCWSSKPQRIKRVDVYTCQGKGCRVGVPRQIRKLKKQRKRWEKNYYKKRGK